MLTQRLGALAHDFGKQCRLTSLSRKEEKSKETKTLYQAKKSEFQSDISILQCGYVARSQDQTYKVLTIVVSHSGRFKKPTGLLSSWRNYWKWWFWCSLCWILQTNWKICKSVVYLHKQR